MAINMTVAARAGAWISAAEASRRLGVTRATLYAYVSRGFVRSQASSGASRERTYARDDIERLRQRTEERRAPDKAAAHALQWGMPILESSIALIDGARLYYRGLDAAVLARSRTLEEVAALVWTGRFDALRAPALAARLPQQPAGVPFAARAQSMLAVAAARDPLAFDLRPASVASTGMRILRLLTQAAIGADPGSRTIDAALARAWKTGAGGADVVRAALVLCADHELNVSSFTARCVASSGSHPYAVVIAGLAALEGPKHGGASIRAESMLASLRQARPIRAAVSARLRRGEPIDGFGHPLYREGDPRARLLLELLGERYRTSAEYRFVATFARAAAETTGEHPNIDFGLAAAARVLGLPAGSPFTLFAIGRTVGWLGHAIEQYATGQLIRPRAKYVGVPPLEVS
ncbi:MAG TPA: citrate/2-methylcitrate synthase [Vicinamibacterales bacterium]|nr:citrate/2-methylcitrate synthase [Vicinamibacterales bacterium]